jgi:hypothetical protein
MNRVRKDTGRCGAIRSQNIIVSKASVKLETTQKQPPVAVRCAFVFRQPRTRGILCVPHLGSKTIGYAYLCFRVVCPALSLATGCDLELVLSTQQPPKALSISFILILSLTSSAFKVDFPHRNSVRMPRFHPVHMPSSVTTKARWTRNVRATWDTRHM